MGIITDFLILKQRIDDYNFKSPIKKLINRFQRKKLMEIANKISKANVPLSKDDILELAQSLYTSSIGESFNELTHVSYYPYAKTFRLKLFEPNFEGTNIVFCEITLSKEEEKFEIKLETVNDNGIINVSGLNLETMHTNIKELEKEIKICNEVLYQLIQNYIFDVIIKTK